MSFRWDSVDERERAKKDNEKALKDFLKTQNEQNKQRKQKERMAEMDEFKRLYGTTGDKAIPKPAEPSSSPNRTITTNPGNLLNPLPVGVPNSSAITPPNFTSNLQNSLSYGNNPVSQYPSQSNFPTNPGLQFTPTGTGIGNNTMVPYQPSFNSALQTSVVQQAAYDEILAKLRLSEEQLQQERRSRAWVESDLQNGKSLLATLSARVDKLAEVVGNDSASLQNAAKMIVESDQRSRDTTSQLSVRIEKDTLKLHQLLADVIGRQKADESYRREQEEKSRAMAEELNHLRYKIEAHSLKANQVGTEFYAKLKEWESDSQRSSDALRVIKEHDHALASLHSAVDTSADSISRKMDITLTDLRQRLEGEARARHQFEENIRDLYGEVRKTLQTQEREFVDRLETLKQSIFSQAEREKRDNEKTISILTEQIRTSERINKESQSQLLEKLSQQLLAIDNVIAEERQARKSLETQTQAAIEEGFRIVQQTITRKNEEYQAQQTELKSNFSQAIKSIQDSLVLVEKTGEQRLSSIEEVLRAEIKARMETDTSVTGLAEDFGLKLDLLEKRTTAKFDEGLEDLQTVRSSLENEIIKTADQLNKSKSRAIDDLESQITPIFSNMKALESNIEHYARQMNQITEKIQSDVQQDLEQLQIKMNKEITLIRNDDQSNDLKYRELELLCQNIKTDMDDKLNLKTVQLDSSMEAFKEELIMRVSKRDVEEMENRLQSSINNIHTTADYLQSQFAQIKEGQTELISKSDLTDSELKLKSQLSTLSSKIVQVEQSLIKTVENTADHVKRKDLNSAEDRLKAILATHNLKSTELEDHIREIKSDLSFKAAKESLKDIEGRLLKDISSIELKMNDFMTDINETINLKATKEDVQECQQKLDEMSATQKVQLESAETQLEAMSTKLGETLSTEWTKKLETQKRSLAELSHQYYQSQEKFDAFKKATSDQLALQKDTFSTLTINQAESFELNKRAFQDQIKEINRRFDAFPRQLSLMESHLNEAKSSLSQQIESEHAILVRHVSELRQGLDSKVSDIEFDSHKSEFNAAVLKFGAKIEMENTGLGSLRELLNQQESQIMESIAQTRSDLEKQIRDCLGATKNTKDLLNRKLEDESKSGSKTVDWVANEVKSLRNLVNSTLSMDVLKLTEDVSTLKKECQYAVTRQDLDRTLDFSVRPLKSKMESLDFNIAELNEKVDSHTRLLSQTSRPKTSKIDASNRPSSGLGQEKVPAYIPASFYKPAHMSFGTEKPTAFGSGSERDLSKPRTPTNAQTKPSTPNINAQMENLADTVSISRRTSQAPIEF